MQHPASVRLLRRHRLAAAVVRMVLLCSAVAGAACGRVAGSTASEPYSIPFADTAKPYSALVRRALERYYPDLLTRGATGHASYVWFVADGRGRITAHAMSGVRPPSMVQRDAIREKFPDLDLQRFAEAVPDAAFPTSGTSLHLPGELGPDSVWVFWVDRPVSFRRVPAPAGPFVFGRAASEQVAPARVRQLASESGAGDVVWYVYSDAQPLLDAGVARGLDPRSSRADSVVAAVRRIVRGRHPAGALTCSLGSALPGLSGQVVMTVSVRYDPPSR